MKTYITCWFIALSLSAVSSQSVFDWFSWKSEESKPVISSDGVPLLAIPYESLTEDEKFLKEAAKFVTDMQVSSPLEICQHKVVLQIKNSCSSMSEEQLAKLSVNLLNCQSETEGRTVFPCTDKMSIKECTMQMDSDTWNSYHLMSNRARAVCYASRSHHFRALTELTVNKLMQTAHSQIKTLETLKENQDRLEKQTVSAHEIMESNIKGLSDEKALIRAGHDQLASMTEDIKSRLEKAMHDLKQQTREHKNNHEELIQDLFLIQSQAHQLWDKIESGSKEAASRYENTLAKLEKMNDTIVYLSSLTDKMHAEIDEKLGWIKQYIGSTGEHLEKIYRITVHIIYIFGAMVVAAFLHAPFLTRTAILGVVPLNLASYLKHGISACLDFTSITVLIILITIMHYVMNGIHYLFQGKTDPCINKLPKSNSKSANQTKDHKDIEPRKFSSFLNLTMMKQKVQQSIGKMQSFFMRIKRWIFSTMTPTEELSCSYLPAKKYQERIVTGKEYPSISDDSSDFSDSRDSARFGFKENNVTSDFLRQRVLEKFNSPLSALTKGSPQNRENTRISSNKPKIINERLLTPSTKPLCGAKTRSGNPCRLLASKGQNFCHRHATGGSTISED